MGMLVVHCQTWQLSCLTSVLAYLYPVGSKGTQRSKIHERMTLNNSKMRCTMPVE